MKQWQCWQRSLFFSPQRNTNLKRFSKLSYKIVITFYKNLKISLQILKKKLRMANKNRDKEKIRWWTRESKFKGIEKRNIAKTCFAKPSPRLQRTKFWRREWRNSLLNEPASRWLILEDGRKLAASSEWRGTGDRLIYCLWPLGCNDDILEETSHTLCCSRSRIFRDLSGLIGSISQEF